MNTKTQEDRVVKGLNKHKCLCNYKYWESYHGNRPNSYMDGNGNTITHCPECGRKLGLQRRTT